MRNVMPKRYFPETAFTVDTDLIYNLMHNTNVNGSLSYRDGKPQMCNDVMIRLTKSHGSKMSEEELKDFAKFLTKAANDYMFTQFNAAFEETTNSCSVGDYVVITDGSREGKAGVISIIHPAGEIDSCAIFTISFGSRGGRGQYKYEQFSCQE